MGRSALVIGATGLIGRELVKGLLEDEHYEEVWVVVRKSFDVLHPKIRTVIGFEGADQALGHIDDVYCALGTTRKKAKTKSGIREVDLDLPVQMAKIAQKHGATRYMVVSSQGASLSSPIYYARVKGELENTLRTLEFDHLVIARPSLLLGDRQEFRLGEKLGEWLTLPFRGLLRKYSPNTAPIEAKDVAKALRLAAREGSGVEVLTSDALYQLAHD